MAKLFVLLFTMVSFSVIAQRTDQKLQTEIAGLTKGFNGQVGIYVYDLKKNRQVAIHADTIFTTASMVKIPILIGVMEKLGTGGLQYHQPLVYKDSLLYAGVDILGSFKNNETIELSKVMMLMLTMSDNTASLWLQSLAGGGTRINQLMDSLGLIHTRVNSRTPGREEDKARYGWGQTTPREMATLLLKIARGQLLSKQASQQMLKLISRNYWDEGGIAQIPAGVFVASKTGAVDASRSEVMYINGKHSSYVLCICTQNNSDTSWQQNNEAWQLIRKISEAVWRRYK